MPFSVQSSLSAKIGRGGLISLQFLTAIGAAEAFDPTSQADADRLQGMVVRIQEPETKGTFRGVGVITAVDSRTGALTIDHEEIKGLMPAMVMTYRVDPPSLIGRLHSGDRIEFVLDAGRYTITEIKLLPR
jgi:Cu/Ag efflux protein CusF